MGFSPASSGSGGGSFNGGTITAPLAIATTDLDTSALEVQVLDGMNEYAIEASTPTGPKFQVYAENVAAFLDLVTSNGAQVLLSVGTTGGSLSGQSPTGASAFALNADPTTDLAQFLVASAIALRISSGGYLVISTHAAPADAALAAGDCALWFDQTNGAGATKLMAKGKSADGTVKTAAILLA